MTAAKKPVLPVESFDEAYPFLRRPFVPEAVHFKPQSITGSNPQDASALVLAYIDARNVTARLNAVVGGRWQEQHTDSEGGMICQLTVCDVTHSDWGTTEAGLQEIRVKGNWSDSLKRAAVRFGIGESLYAVPQVWVRGEARLKTWSKNGGRLQGRLTPTGIQHCRDLYGEWLERVGIKAFGEPLDHGDGGKESDAETLGRLIADAKFTEEQTSQVREWAKNGNGLDPVKVTKAIHLLLAEEPEVLLGVAS